MGKLKDFVKAPVGSSTPGVWRNTVGDAVDTVQNIGEKTGDFLYQAQKDAVQSGYDSTKAVTDLGLLVDDPSEWFYKTQEPTFGGPNGEPGLWDKYGAFINLVPGGSVIYGIGQAYNTAWDYHRTGDEDQFRDNARNLATAYVANNYISPAIKPYTYGVEPVLGTTGAAVTHGAVMGATQGALSGGGTEGAKRGAVTGGAAAGLGTLFGGGTGVYDDDGNLIDIHLGSPTAGHFGSQLGSIGTGAYFAAEDRRDSQRALDDYLRTAIDNYKQFKTTGDSNESSFPEWQQELVGTPQESLLGDLFTKEEDKKKTSIGGGQYGPQNSQLSYGNVRQEDVQSGHYT